MEKDYDEKLAKLAKGGKLKKDFAKIDNEEQQNKKEIAENNENDPYIQDLPFIREGENNQFDNPDGEVGFK